MKRKRENWDYGESDMFYSKDKNAIRKYFKATENQVPTFEVSAECHNAKLLPVPDLIAEKTVYFGIHKDKRATTTAIGTTTKTCIRRHIRLFLPDLLTEQVWKRHQYSLEDVSRTLEMCPKAYIWQLALYYQVQILNSASKASWSTPSIIYGGKSSAKERIMRELSKNGSGLAHWEKRVPRLLQVHHAKQPVYCLPYHWISAKSMSVITQHLPTEHPDGKKWLGDLMRAYDQFLLWSGGNIAVVPLAHYAALLPDYEIALLNRIAPYRGLCERYQLDLAKDLSVTNCYDLVNIQGEEYALLDEAFYVVSRRA